MTENHQYYKTTTLSGNVVMFANTAMARLFVLSQDGKTILRGALGDAAKEYWQKVSQDKQVVSCDWGATLSRVEGAFPKLMESFGTQIPSRELWFTRITDGDIESPNGGGACADRYTFYRVTNLANVTNGRGRENHLEGEFEVILLFFHILQAGKLNRIMQIWDHGKEGSLAPKGYVKSLLDSIRFRALVSRQV